MTRSRLHMVIVLVGVFYLILVFLFFGADPDGVFVQQMRYAMPLLVGLPAAGLVEAFRRRSALQEALRKLYYSVIDDLQAAIRYTKLTAPSEEAYFDTLRSMSTSIDRVRAHFSNIPRAGHEHDLYPIEGVKTFYTWIEYLGGGDQWRGAKASAETRAALIDLWKYKVREPLLSELDRHQPDQFLSPYAGDELWRLPPSEYLRTEARAPAQSEN